MAYNFNEFIKKIQSEGLESFGLYYSIYPAVVEDNSDPDKRGRIKLSVPQITNGVINKWAEPVTSGTEKNSGFFSIPEVGANIWCLFRHGDTRFPVWLGTYWIDEGAPESAKGEDYPAIHVWQIPNGSKLFMNDKTGEVLLSDKGGNMINFDGGSVSKWSLKDNAFIRLNAATVELNGADQAAVLGDTLKAELTKLNEKFDLLITILQAWVPVPQDGGLALKTLLATLFPLPSADFSAILSAVVKLK